MQMCRWGTLGGDGVFFFFVLRIGQEKTRSNIGSLLTLGCVCVCVFCHENICLKTCFVICFIMCFV